jgi:chemotaxis protein CheD
MVNLNSARPLVLAPAAKGFAHINRYWDPTHKLVTAKILPGECYVSTGNEMITTVLGSCVSACIRDPVLKVGGMNHFMLPLQLSGTAISRSAVLDPALCYGNWAMEFLINAIIKLGGRKDRLEIKIFGGGRVLAGMNNIDVGKQNIEFVQQYLAKEGLAIMALDVGDIYPRKLLYFPDTGKVKMKKLRSAAAPEISIQERSYLESIAKPLSGNVELF